MDRRGEGVGVDTTASMLPSDRTFPTDRGGEGVPPPSPVSLLDPSLPPSLLASSSVHSFDTLGDCRTGDASPDAVPVPLLDLLPEYGDLPADLAG